MTYTFATMAVSKAAYDEIKRNLIKAGYGHALHYQTRDQSDDPLLDMRGIALELDEHRFLQVSDPQDARSA